MKVDTDQQKKEFIQLLENAILEQQFVKLTLSKPVKSEDTLPKNIYGRLVTLKKGLALSCTFRYPTEDQTKNYLLAGELSPFLEEYLGAKFLIATLLTSNGDLVLKYNKKRKASLNRIGGNIRKAPVPSTHNHQKQYLIDADRPFLEKLGLSSKKGMILQQHQDKYRQINKYVEIMQRLLLQSKLLEVEKPLHIVDMGSGKGYLSFALYEFLREKSGLPVEMLGIELRPNLVEFCNAQSKALGWADGLRFCAMDILNYNAADIDVLIALHACDVATDIAIAQGINNGAKLIVTAPCCHKQIRSAMQPKGPWAHSLRQGILLERQAEWVTDSIRALLLEAKGYKTKVFEFISNEHTAKNLMITAIKEDFSPDYKAERLEEVAALKAAFGIEQHYLETLLP